MSGSPRTVQLLTPSFPPRLSSDLVEIGGSRRLGDRRAARPLGAEGELEPRHREGAVGAVRGLSLRSAGGEQGKQKDRQQAATEGHERPPSGSGYGFLDRIVGRWNRGDRKSTRLNSSH